MGIYEIKKLIIEFERSNNNSLGIVCKTQKQSDKLYESLQDDFNISLLNAASVAFGSGIVITTAHLTKGLEFDQVIVPYCTDKNYHTEPDRQMLYVACTRAMHHLFLTHTSNPAQFIVN